MNTDTVILANAGIQVLRAILRPMQKLGPRFREDDLVLVLRGTLR
jgi:hypothetical protein